ncbi:MAG: hypothetical protein WD294_06765 [Phycisphaeraceae bacterium]
MTTQPMRWTLLCVLTGALTLAAKPALAELPEEGAALAPADSGVFIELDDLAQVRRELEQDPLINYLREHTPAKREPAAWRAVQDAMGMSGEQLFDRYFGQQLVIVGEGTQEGGPGVMLSRVSEDDAELAIERLDLQRVAEPGAFELYHTADGLGRLAFGDGWMAMGDPAHEDYIQRLLGSIGQAETLADSPVFQQWIGKVADGSFARMFVQDPDKNQIHAAAVEREEGRLELRYAGQSDETSQLLSRVSDAEALEFGPLPRQTISATTLNLRDDKPDAGFVALMDRLLGNATYEGDVLPKLGAPIVTFLGEVKGEELVPRAAFSAPVLGIAIKLRDQSVAEELDRAMQNMLMFANVATMQMEVDPIELMTVEHEGVTFRSADVGTPLAQQLGEPSLAGAAQVSFGRIGDWYVVTTNAQYFEWCINADSDNAWRIDTSADVTKMNLAAPERPIATSFLRAPELAAHVRTWVAYAGAREPQWLDDAERDEPNTKPGRVIKGLTLLAGVLDHYEGMSVQVYGGEEEDTLRANALLQRQ